MGRGGQRLGDSSASVATNPAHQPFLVGTYSDMEALAHQPYAPSPGVGIQSMQLADNTFITGIATPELNPAVLIPHPNGTTMYGILETIRERGLVTRYTVDGEGKLTKQDTWTASGKSTCYLALAPSRNAAIVINYWDSVVDVVDVDPVSGALGQVLQSFIQVRRSEGEWRQVVDKEDHWANRRVGPHAHCAHFWKQWVFCPNLGEDAVFQYRWDAEHRRLEEEACIEFEAGSGPRHMAFHPTLPICYVSNELLNTVCVARLDDTNSDAVKPRLIPEQYLSTLEDDTDIVSYVSEIKLSSDARFLYVSNRGHDSIAVFKVLADGLLERSSITPTGGRFPRHFAISPDGCAVVVANQDSGHIRLLDRDCSTGALALTDTCVPVAAPCYVRFL